MNPHQCLLAKKVDSKVDNDYPKVPKQAEAKRNGVKNPHKITISINFNTENCYALKTLR